MSNMRTTRTAYADAPIMDRRLLERHAAKSAGASHGIMLESARNAIILVLEALGIGKEDKVLCPALGIPYVIQCITRLEAKPVLVDINPNTLNIDPYCLEYVINKCVREKSPLPAAVITADMYGLPCNYSEITRICENFGIPLIEDMGASFGASANGDMAGSFGRFATASFFGSETPDGGRPFGEEGIIFCHSERDAESIRWLQHEKNSVHTGASVCDVPEIIVSGMLGHFNTELKSRRSVTNMFREKLRGKTRLQEAGGGYESACTHLAVILGSENERDNAANRLSREGASFFLCAPNTRRDAVNPPKNIILTNAESICRKMLVLPLYSHYTKSVVEFLCELISDSNNNLC